MSCNYDSGWILLENQVLSLLSLIGFKENRNSGRNLFHLTLCLWVIQAKYFHWSMFQRNSILSQPNTKQTKFSAWTEIRTIISKVYPRNVDRLSNIYSSSYRWVNSNRITPTAFSDFRHSNIMHQHFCVKQIKWV